MAYNNEADRRSAVSSFYGGRKGSIDALNNDQYASRNSAALPPGAGFANPHRVRADSSSTFFGPARGSRADMDVQTPSAGYNRASYFDVGREAPVKGGIDEEENVAFTQEQGLGYDAGTGQEDAWDVYADFNNTGPRYSTAFGKQDGGYYQLPPQGPPSVLGKADDAGSKTSSLPVELVTVPALGPEWRKEEIKNMTAHGRSEDVWYERRKKFTEWRRDQRAICGKWGTRKQIVIGGFIFAVILSITLALTIPRVPSFSFDGSSPLLNATNATSAPSFFPSPANFSFEAILALESDPSGNFLPLHFNHIDATIFDLNTDMQVGTGNITDLTIPANQNTAIELPLSFSFLGSNDTDPTWLDFYNACKNPAIYINNSRPGLNLEIVLELDIAGLIGSKGVSTQITDVSCPFELPENAE